MKKCHAPIPRNLAPLLSGTWAAGIVLAGMMAIVAPPASAGTIGITSDGKLIVGTEAGDPSQSISASIAGTNLVISGVKFDLVTPGCTRIGDVFCSLSGFNELIVLGGNGDDAIILSAIAAPPPFTTLILGGSGNDVLVGSGGDDTIFGGPGDDILIGGPGVDCLSPGPGNNVLIQAPLSCAGPDPVITPLPRTETAVPEPSGLLLLATGLAFLPLARSMPNAKATEALVCGSQVKVPESSNERATSKTD